MKKAHMTKAVFSHFFEKTKTSFDQSFIILNYDKIQPSLYNNKFKIKYIELKLSNEMDFFRNI